MSSENFPSIIVFDVNETLLDIDTLTPFFTRVFGKQNILREWFAQLVLYSQTMTLSGLYTPFGEIGVGALQMIADIRQVTLTESDIDEFKERMSALPAHPDAAPALSAFYDKLRLVMMGLISFELTKIFIPDEDCQ